MNDNKIRKLPYTISTHMLYDVVQYRNNYHIGIQWQEKGTPSDHVFVGDSNKYQGNSHDVYRARTYPVMIPSYSELMWEDMLL